jgi:hypothetical protein
VAVHRIAQVRADDEHVPPGAEVRLEVMERLSGCGIRQEEIDQARSPRNE